MYKAGEYVIKPNTGICRIEEIVDMDLTGDGVKSYYLLRPIDDKKATLYVTVDADRKRLRLAMNEEEARDFIGSIPDIEEMWIANDKMREQKYKEAFRSNVDVVIDNSGSIEDSCRQVDQVLAAGGFRKKTV